MNSELLIRPIRPDEATDFQALATSVGWSHAIADCRFLIEEPTVLAVFAECDGRVVGSAGAACYGERELAFINMVIVREEFRHRGIASAMVCHLMHELSEYRTFRLHASPAGAPVYARLGFRPGATLSRLFRTPGGPIPAEAAPVQPLTTADCAEILARDRACCGVARPAVLADNFRRSLALGRKLVAADGRSLHGFVLARERPGVRELAALECVHETAARQLLAGVMAETPETNFGIVIYDRLQSWREYLDRAGFVFQRPLLEMEYGAPGPTPTPEYFGVYGGDLG